MHDTQSEQIRGDLVASRQGVVIASCQAGRESPLNQSSVTALGRSAELGGAQGFRVDGPANVAAVRAVSAKTWRTSREDYRIAGR